MSLIPPTLAPSPAPTSSPPPGMSATVPLVGISVQATPGQFPSVQPGSVRLAGLVVWPTQGLASAAPAAVAALPVSVVDGRLLIGEVRTGDAAVQLPQLQAGSPPNVQLDFTVWPSTPSCRLFVDTSLQRDPARGTEGDDVFIVWRPPALGLQQNRYDGQGGYDMVLVLPGSTLAPQDDGAWVNLEAVVIPRLGEAVNPTAAGTLTRVELAQQTEAVAITCGDSLHSVYSGQGADRLIGGPREDDLHAGDGADTVHGGDGRDFIEGGAGDDLLDGGAGDDLLYPDEYQEWLGPTGSGDDTVIAGEGRDHIWSWGGRDVLDLTEAAPAPDTLTMWAMDDQACTVKGFAPGQDRLSLYAGGVTQRFGEWCQVLEPQASGVLMLDTAQAGLFYFHRGLVPLAEAGARCELLVSAGALGVENSEHTRQAGGACAYLMVMDGAGPAQVAALFRLKDANLDGWVAGGEIALIGVFSGGGPMPADVLRG